MSKRSKLVKLAYNVCMITIFTVLVIVAGCTSSTNQSETVPIQVEIYEAIDIPFEKGEGRVTIVYKDKHHIDVIVLAKGLNPEEHYQIVLGSKGGGGLSFGQRENVQITFGKINLYSLFQPNEKGEVYVSMKNPIRIVSGAKEVRIKVRTPEGKDIMVSKPFVFLEK